MSKAAYLTEMFRAWSDCQGCQLCHERRSVVFGYGNPDADLLVIGEAPGYNEDMTGVPFVGSAGQLLDQYLTSVSMHPDLLAMLKDQSFDPDEARNVLLNSVFYTNVVACRPPDNRDPTPGEMEACKIRLYEIIYTVDPALIIGVGRVPVEFLVKKKITITKERGEVFDIQIPGRLGATEKEPNMVTYPLLAVLHPAYLLRVNDFASGGIHGMSGKTERDFMRALQLLDWFNWTHEGIELPPREKTIAALKAQGKRK